MVRIQAVYGLSMAVLLVVIAPILVPVLFGARWVPAVVAMEVLSLYAVARSFAMGATDVYKGMARPRLAFWSSLAWLVTLVPVLLIGTNHGINGVSWAQLVIATLAFLAMHGVAIRRMRLPLRKLGRALGPALLATLGTAVGAAAVRAWLPGPAAVRLAAATMAGVGLGVAMLHAADRELIPEIRRLLRPPGGRRQGNGAEEEVETKT